MRRLMGMGPVRGLARLTGATRLERLGLAFILLAGGGLALAYGLHGLWQASWLPVGLGLGWWAARGRSRHAASIGMAGFFLLAAGGLWLGMAALPVLLVTGSALVAWDLDGFQRRLRAQEPDPALRELVRRHLKTLGAVVLAGLWVTGVTMSLTLSLDFWVVAAIGLLLAIILGRALALINRKAGAGSPETPD